MSPSTNAPGDRAAKSNVWALALLGAVTFPAAYFVCAEPAPVLDVREYETGAAPAEGGDQVPIPLPPCDPETELAYAVTPIEPQPNATALELPPLDAPGAELPPWANAPVDPPVENLRGNEAGPRRRTIAERFQSLTASRVQPHTEQPAEYEAESRRQTFGDRFSDFAASPAQLPAEESAAIEAEPRRQTIGERFNVFTKAPAPPLAETVEKVEVPGRRRPIGERFKSFSAALGGQSSAPSPPVEAEPIPGADAPSAQSSQTALSAIQSVEPPTLDFSETPSIQTFEPSFVDTPEPTISPSATVSVSPAPEIGEVETAAPPAMESSELTIQLPVADSHIPEMEIAEVEADEPSPVGKPAPDKPALVVKSKTPVAKIAQVDPPAPPRLPPQGVPIEPPADVAPPAETAPLDLPAREPALDPIVEPRIEPMLEPTPSVEIPTPALELPAPAEERPSWIAPPVIECQPPCAAGPTFNGPCGPGAGLNGNCPSGLAGCHEDPGLAVPSSIQGDILELLAVDIARRSLLAIHPYAAERPIITLDVVVRPSGHEVHTYARLQWYRHHWYQSRELYKTYESEVSASIIYHPDQRRVYDISYVDNACLPFRNVDMTSQVVASYNGDFALRDATGLPPKFLSDRVDVLEPYPKPRIVNHGPVMEPDPKAKSLRTVRRDSNVTANQ